MGADDSLAGTWMENYRYYDEPIDPDLYLIRPGEKLTVTFIRTKLGEIDLEVGPDGAIVHQSLGVIDLGGKTLSQARALLIPELKRQFNAEQITVAVSDPVLIAVTVTGAVDKPGLYKLFTSQRVSEAIEMAGGLAWGASSRNIILSGGPVPVHVDLDLARYAGDNSLNPCLYAGDAILVPDKSSDRVQVVGEVNRPREIELLPGDDLTQLITLAGGFRSSADSSRVRIIANGSGSSTNDRVSPGTVIEIPAVAELHPMLTIYGAVNQTGRFDYAEGSTVGKLIEQAGGMMTDANRDQLTVFRRAGVDEWGRITRTRYPVTSAYMGSSGILEMKLMPDDSVFVPFNVGFVKVSGEVLNPGRFPYVAGKDAAFYITAAGDFLPRADRNRINVLNRVARVTSTISPGVLVHDGDELVVQVKEEYR
ncbi:MAG TPA: SLBB domain-containing protein [candidate division Zixibacteria bacterium]|nr:SLBB domain-containing protein [candidate division Zixibacteria bacterium]